MNKNQKEDIRRTVDEFISSFPNHPEIELFLKLKSVDSPRSLLRFLRDYNFMPEYYEAPEGRKEFLSFIIDKIYEYTEH